MPTFVRFVMEPCYGQAWGLVEGDTVRVVEGSPYTTFEETNQMLDLSDIQTFLPPTDPPNILAIGRNYKEHAEETGAKAPKAPVIFIKATTAITSHGQPIMLPKEAPQEVDYEAELVVIMGKRAKHVSEERALDYVLGYTCGNDVSARDCQVRYDKQWARGKSFDSFAPMGPYLVTDFDPFRAQIVTRLNGEVMQQSNTDRLIFNVAQLVSYLSRQMTLMPATAIMTGTPAGVGFVRKPPVFLRQGDVCEVEIEGLGVLRNPVTVE